MMHIGDWWNFDTGWSENKKGNISGTFSWRPLLGQTSYIHWKLTVFLMPTWLSLVAPQAVIMTICGAVRDNKVGFMTTLCFNVVQSHHCEVSLAHLTHFSPSAAYMCQWTGSALVQIMACRLFGAKPLPEPMLTYCQMDPQEQMSMKSESEF